MLRAAAAATASAAAAAAVPHGGAPCSVDDDCMLNGACAGGACACPPQWTGPRCGALNLVAARVQSGHRDANATSWGGSVTAQAGVYHMYLAKMRGSCGLTSWRTNSYVAHAVSDSPVGPYTVVDEVRPSAFAHNPAVSRVGGGWVLSQIGCAGGGTVPRACRNGSTPGVVPHPPPVAAPAAGAGQRGGCDNPHWTGAAFSSSPTGPWPPSVATQLSAAAAGSWRRGTGFTNPSVLGLVNGSVMVAYSTGAVPPRATRKHIGVALAADWRGPYADLTPDAPVFDLPHFNNSEDPFLWRDRRGYFHLLAHTGYGADSQPDWRHVSAHAFSRDGRAWTASPDPPYSRTIAWEGGAETEVFARERPQLILDDGVPVALLNGVEPGNTTMPFTRGFTGDWSYTHAQGVCASAACAA